MQNIKNKKNKRKSVLKRTPPEKEKEAKDKHEIKIIEAEKNSKKNRKRKLGKAPCKNRLLSQNSV